MKKEDRMQVLEDYRIYSFHSYGSSFDQQQWPILGHLVDGLQEPASPSDGYDRDHMKRPPVFVPARVRRSLALRYRDKPIFVEDKQDRGRDFYMPLKHLVNGRDKTRSKIFRLSDLAKRLLTKCDLYAEDVEASARCQHRLALELSTAGHKRIEAALQKNGLMFPTELLTTPVNATARPIAVIPLRIHDVLLYRFSTDRVIFQLELEPVLPDHLPVTASLFAEIVDLISRFPNLTWLEVGADKTNSVAQGEKFTLGSMVARLLHGGNGVYESSHRTFTHSFAKVTANGSEIDKTTLRKISASFARQYTTDYALSEDAEGVYFVSDFDNVIHAVAREGAATIVNPGVGNVAFLNEYRTAALEQSYLPLIATNLHYHAKAFDLLAHSVFSAQDHTKVHVLDEQLVETDIGYRHKMTEWRELADDVALLNSRFRFRQVSQVSMQNAFNKAIRRAFDLDELEVQLRDDMSQMSSRMQEAIQLRDQMLYRKFERRYFWLPVLATAFAAASLSSQLIQTWNSVPSSKQDHVFWAQIAAFFVPVLIAIAWSVYWRKKRPLS